MTSPTWQTGCLSIATTATECVLPLLGLTGNIVNTTPQFQQALSVTGEDSCTLGGIIAPKTSCSNEDHQRRCNTLRCPATRVDGTCSCVNGRITEGFRRTQRFTCTRQCLDVNPTQSCPGGTLIASRNVGNTVYATCEYTITSGNISSLNTILPAEFIVPMAKRLALSEYLTAWMNELYVDQTSFFHQTNYLRSSVDIKGGVFSRSGVQRYARYIPDWNQFRDFMLEVSAYPTLFFQPENVFRVILYLYNTEPNLSQEEMTRFIRGFTVEPQTGPTLSAPLTEFNAPGDLLTNGAYIIADLTNLRVYNNDITDPTRLLSIQQLRAQGVTGDLYIVGRAYPSNIIRWSPNLLYLYSLVHMNLPYDRLGAGGFCDRILAQTGQIPVVCYNNTCIPTFTDQCRTYLQTYCGAENIYDSGFTGINFDVEQFLLNANAAQCQCYNSRLSPPIIPAGNRPAMCFTTACTSEPGIIQNFQLTETVCGGFCEEVYQWITSPDPARGSVNPNVLDVARYKRLCGALPQDIETRPLNYYVLIAGIVFGLIVGIILLLITRKIWIALIPFVILLGLSVFLAFDLNGVPGCDDTKQVCRTRFTGISVPIGLCSYQIGCECSNYGGRCEDGRLCLAGKCFDPPE